MAQHKVGRAIVVVMRVANLPEPWVPSTKVPCSECGEETWIGPAAYEKIEEPVPVCVQCTGMDLREIMTVGEQL